MFRRRDSGNEFAVIADDTVTRCRPDEGSMVVVPVGQEGLDVATQGRFGRRGKGKGVWHLVLKAAHLNEAYGKAPGTEPPRQLAAAVIVTWNRSG